MTQVMGGHLVDKVEISKKDAKQALDEFTMLVVCELKKEGSILLGGLGIFRKAKHATHVGRNPTTGVQIKNSGTNAAPLHARRGPEGFDAGRDHCGSEGEI